MYQLARSGRGFVYHDDSMLIAVKLAIVLIWIGCHLLTW